MNQNYPVPCGHLELLPSSRFHHMSLRGSPPSMHKTNSSTDGHTPQPGMWYNPKEACPWPKEKYERALNSEYFLCVEGCDSNADDLPKPVAQALNGWMKASQATAIIVGLTVVYWNIYGLLLTRNPQTALLAVVQAGMIAVIEGFPDSYESAHWRTFRFYVYAGVFFDLGATASLVCITVQGAALPVLARRKAMARDPESGPYRQIHEPGHMMPRDLLDGGMVCRYWRCLALAGIGSSLCSTCYGSSCLGTYSLLCRLFCGSMAGSYRNWSFR